jgi:hypothetical protein
MPTTVAVTRTIPLNATKAKKPSTMEAAMISVPAITTNTLAMGLPAGKLALNDEFRNLFP